ncbi:hypothetical protein PHYC_02390 [Phycisphaerales bacterium]|nr:hypothetical protein PHYC_02390 [Phycisphaerales bacterium]
MLTRRQATFLLVGIAVPSAMVLPPAMRQFVAALSR